MEFADAATSLLQMCLALLAVAAAIASVVLQAPLLAYVRARAAEIDNALLRATIESLIEFAEAKLKSSPGRQRMEYVLDQLDARGLDPDEKLAEAVFQAWQRKQKAAAAAPEPAAAPAATGMEVASDA